MKKQVLTAKEFMALVSKKKNKHGNKMTVTSFGTFHSKREADRYQCLHYQEIAGTISNLRKQVPFDLSVNGIKVCKYIADFVYLHDGETIVEDSKGFRDSVYKLKKRLMLAIHGIEILET
jgi:hypothetical protein